MPESQEVNDTIERLVKSNVSVPKIYEIVKPQGLRVKQRQLYNNTKPLREAHQQSFSEQKRSSTRSGQGRFRLPPVVHLQRPQSGATPLVSTLNNYPLSNEPPQYESEEPISGRAAYGRRRQYPVANNSTEDGEPIWSTDVMDEILKETYGFGRLFEDIPVCTKDAKSTTDLSPAYKQPASEAFLHNFQKPVYHAPTVSIPQTLPNPTYSVQATTSNWADLGSVLPTETTGISGLSLVSPSLPSTASWADIEEASFASAQFEPNEPSLVRGTTLGAPVVSSSGSINYQLLDHYNNSQLHYIAASGTADLETLLRYSNDPDRPFERPNTLGQTPMHMFNPASLTAADLETLLKEVCSYQFLFQARDNQARTVLSALVDHIWSVDKLLVLFKFCKLDENTSNDLVLWQMFNARDRNNHTVVDKIFNRLQYLSQQSHYSESEAQVFNQISALIATELSRQYSRHRHDFSTGSDLFERRFVENFDEKAYQDLFMEDEKKSSLLHAIPWFRQDASIQKKKLEWALTRSSFNATISALITLDVNKPDEEGYGPLQSAALAMCFRRPQNMFVSHVRKEVQHLGLTGAHNLEQFINQIQAEQIYSTTPKFVTDSAIRWHMSGSTLIQDFLKRAQLEQAKQEANVKDCFVELLRKRRSEDILKALQRSDSTDNIASVSTTSRKQKRHSLPPGAVQVQDVIEIFCSKGANVNQKDRQGWIPLNYVCCHGIRDHVRLFLRYGSNPNSRDNHGKGVIAIARESMSGTSDLSLKADIEACISDIIQAGGKEAPTAADEYFARGSTQNLAFL